MFERIGTAIVGAFFGGGIGGLLAQVTHHEVAGVIACIVAASGGFVWLGRMIWKASHDRADVIGKLHATSTQVTGLVIRVENVAVEVHDRINAMDTKLDCIDRKVAEISTRCIERSKLYDKALRKLGE